MAVLTALFACKPGGDDESPDTSSGEPGAVKVTLSWDAPVDMDLEIWDSQGQNLLFRVFDKIGSDCSDGSADEYFIFQKYGAEDYTAGKYVVSVFFFTDDSTTTSLTSADITLTVTKADGTVETIPKTIYREEGRNQWHAFRIDAATGAMETIDDYLEIEYQQ